MSGGEKINFSSSRSQVSSPTTTLPYHHHLSPAQCALTIKCGEIELIQE